MTALIGRDAELNTLKQHLADAVSGKGSTMLISGEPGIGKTALVGAFKEYAATQNVKILSGAASADSAQPFLVFSKALGEVMDKPLFEEQEYTQFVKIFVINHAGMLVAEASSGEEGMDADIFAGMLSAVQNFVGDSLDTAGEQKSGLGRLEYGDMKILIEHGQHLFLTGVFAGGEHPDMKAALKRTLQRIEEEHGAALERWSGKVSEVEPVRREIMKLSEAKFLVRRDLEGVKLENERIRIGDRVLETLLHLARGNTLILFLEDLHWADESSRFVLNYLARNIRKSQVLLLGTLRPMESDALQATIEKMRSEEIMDEVTLEKLDIEHTFSLINNTYSPNEFPETLTEKLFEQSKGNPLFVIEMLKSMYDDGSIAMQGGKYSLISESYQIPATVEEAVNRRLEALDPDSMAMIEYASCIGQRFDASIAASNRMIKDPNASLGKLLGAGILLRKNGDLEFSHAVFQSVIYEGIGGRWKVGHHRSIGEYLESTYIGRIDEVIYGLAMHFSRTKEYKKSYDYCMKAGEKAEGSFAVEQALEFYDNALAVLEKLNVINSRERMTDLLERIGDVQNIIGNFGAAIAKFQMAKDITDDKETKTRMLRKIGDVHERKGDHKMALEILTKAKERIDAGTLEYGRICLAKGRQYWRGGDYEKALSLLSESITTSVKAGGDKITLGNALRAIGNIYLARGDKGSAIKYYEESLATMESIGHNNGIAAASNNIGNVYRSRGELKTALEFYERSLEIDEKMGDKWSLSGTLNNIGLVYWIKGELDMALDFYGQSLDIRETIGDKRGIALSLNNIGAVNSYKGELDKALEFYERCLKMQERTADRQNIPSTFYNIGEVYWNKGELDKALEFHKRGMEIREKLGDRKGIAYSLQSIGDVFHDKGDLDKALECYSRSLAAALEIGNKSLPILSYCSLVQCEIERGNMNFALEQANKALAGSLENDEKSKEILSRRVLGMVYKAMGDWSKASVEFESAEEILKEVADRKEGAKLAYEHALFFKDMSDLPKARECLEKALSEFERMGMKLWADKCRKALAGLTPRQSPHLSRKAPPKPRTQARI